MRSLYLRSHKLYLLALLCLTLSTYSGCSSGDRPELGYVTGTVTLDGQPMPDAMVQFYQKGLRPSKALTKADGSYELVYLRNIKGVALGQHTVYIDRVTEHEVTPKNLRLPECYNTQSELIAEVKPGANVFDWPLSSEGEKQ